MVLHDSQICKWPHSAVSSFQFGLAIWIANFTLQKFAWVVGKQFVVFICIEIEIEFFKCFLCGDDQSNHWNLLHFWMTKEEERERDGERNDLMSFESWKLLRTNIDMNWIYVHLINSALRGVGMHWIALVYFGTMVGEWAPKWKTLFINFAKIPWFNDEIEKGNGYKPPINERAAHL